MTANPNKMYDSSNLQSLNDDFLAARLAEVLPDGPPVAADASTLELDDQLTVARNAMMTSSDPALQEELNNLLQQRYPEGTTDPATTREAWRPDLPSGYTWDATLVAGFEDAAPGGQSLMHVAADALRSSSRWHDPNATIDALEARHGIDEAEALAEDATSYVKAYVSPKIQAALKAQGLFYHPELIRTAASFWRQSRRG
jgi:hypothetical protein